MSTLTLVPDNDAVNFLPGQQVALKASWQLDAPAEWLEIRLFWFTSGKGTRDVNVVYKQRWNSPPLQGQRRVELTLPMFPYSFSGKLVSLTWSAELVLAGDKQAVNCQFAMSPTGEEINLYAGGDPPQDKSAPWRVTTN